MSIKDCEIKEIAMLNLLIKFQKRGKYFTYRFN